MRTEQSSGPVLLTTDTVGGVWRYTVDLVTGLSHRAIPVVVATLGPPPDAAQRAELQDIPLVVTDWPLDWMASGPEQVAQASRGIAALADAHRASLLHLHEPSLGAAMPIQRRTTVAVLHSCLASWWEAMREDALPETLRWRRTLTEQGLMRADAVIAPSRTMAATMARLYPPRALHVVQNGRQAAPATPHRRSATVFASGRLWDAAKNMATLDRAAALIDAPVIVAGSTVSPNGEAVAFEHLHGLGHVPPDRLAAELGRAAVFCSLARYEPFGLGVLEAAQAGCALVLADTPIFRELWDGAALFTDPLDATKVAASLRQALAHPNALGRAASGRAARYTADAMVEGTLAVHRQTLARQAA